MRCGVGSGLRQISRLCTPFGHLLAYDQPGARAAIYITEVRAASMTSSANEGNRTVQEPRDPVRVLILEDVPRDADLMVRELRRACFAPEIRVVMDRQEFVQELERFAPDLILADCALPQFSAAEALEIFNQRSTDAAFIIVSGTIGEESAVQHMKLGADDFLLKDRLARLGPAVQQALEKRQLVEERRRAQQALRRSEKRYRELFLKMSNGVAVYTVKDGGRDFVISDLNPAVERIEKIEKRSVLGQSVHQAFPGIAATGLLDLFRQVWETGLCAEQPAIYYQDERISGWRRNSVYKTNHNEIVAVYEDLTEQMQAQEDLKASEAKYRSIIDHIGIGVTLVNSEMRVLELNPQIREWFPRARPRKRQICYQVFNDPPGSAICDGCPAVASLRDGRMHEFVRQTGVAGTVHNFRVVTSPLRDADSRVVAVIEIVEDITQRLVMERQLRQAQKMEAIGTLAGGIAHDFNNLLSAILGFTELCLFNATRNSQLRDNLQEVMQAGLRAKDLVRQILAFSRQGETDLKPIQLGPIIKEALKLLRSTLPATIEIESHIGSHSLVMCDPTQIHQIIMNLCTNAAYAMEAKGGTLTVRLTDIHLDGPAGGSGHLVPGAYLKLSVADTGEGIAPQHMESIFEPYFSTKQESEGTGLGLAVVHGIVLKYGGEITVRSELGKGAVFDIYLPTFKCESCVHSIEKVEPASGGTEKILFIDDNAQIAAMAKQMLQRLGYEMTIKTDSREALALFKDRPADFDLIITDMTMAGITGDELARKILELSPHTPIILCTGFSKRMSEQKAAQLGIKALAMKPLVGAELARLIRKVLDNE